MTILFLSKWGICDSSYSSIGLVHLSFLLQRESLHCFSQTPQLPGKGLNSWLRSLLIFGQRWGVKKGSSGRDTETHLGEVIKEQDKYFTDPWDGENREASGRAPIQHSLDFVDKGIIIQHISTEFSQDKFQFCYQLKLYNLSFLETISSFVIN